MRVPVSLDQASHLHVLEPLGVRPLEGVDAEREDSGVALGTSKFRDSIRREECIPVRRVVFDQAE